MKNLILFALVATTFISCQKEEPIEPNEPQTEDTTTQEAGYELNFYVVDGGSWTYTDIYVKVDGDSIGEVHVEQASTIVNNDYYGNPVNIPTSDLNIQVNDGDTHTIEFFDIANDQLIGSISGIPFSVDESEGSFFNTVPAFQMTSYGNTTFPSGFQEQQVVEGVDDELFYFLELQQ